MRQGILDALFGCRCVADGGGGSVVEMYRVFYVGLLAQRGRHVCWVMMTLFYQRQADVARYMAMFLPQLPCVCTDWASSGVVLACGPTQSATPVRDKMHQTKK